MIIVTTTTAECGCVFLPDLSKNPLPLVKQCGTHQMRAARRRAHPQGENNMTESRLILPGGGQVPSEPTVGVRLPCQRCGKTEGMPELDADAIRLMQSVAGVILAHEVCPGDEKTDTRRYFEARVQIVEVEEIDEGDGDTGERETRIRVEEFMSFVVGHRATNLEEAMRPLALALGEKWQEGEKNARIADPIALPQLDPS